MENTPRNGSPASWIKGVRNHRKGRFSFIDGLFSRRHHEGTLMAPMKETSSMPEQKRDVADSSEWWTRTQWALEATVSKNEVMKDYGLKMLGALAKSEMAETEEKAMLDAVWQVSSTGMQDEAIDQLIEDLRALQNPSESTDASPRISDPNEDDASASVRKTAGTYRRAYDPTNREQVLSTLRREILAARLKVTLDNKLARETSGRVKLLAGVTLPPLVRHHRRSKDAEGHEGSRGDATARPQSDT
ncbi:MAG: hypothetical protein ACQEXN_03830 [Actinomycetota bacterium]